MGRINDVHNANRKAAVLQMKASQIIDALILLGLGYAAYEIYSVYGSVANWLGGVAKDAAITYDDTTLSIMQASYPTDTDVGTPEQKTGSDFENGLLGYSFFDGGV